MHTIQQSLAKNTDTLLQTDVTKFPLQSRNISNCSAGRVTHPEQSRTRRSELASSLKIHGTIRAHTLE